MTMLAVWLGTKHLADLERVPSGELRLCYLNSALAEFGLGSIALSIALPVAPRHSGVAVRRWVESMLPEGESRTHLEERFEVRRGDSFALLSAIGADCAGAVAFLEPGAEPVNALTAPQPLDNAGLASALTALPQQPLGADEDVRVSLGGLQAKLLLTQMPNGSWARPADGTPSTHIAKPDPLAFPGLVVDEAFTLALAGAAGFRVPDFELRTDWVDRPVLVLRRYDRAVTGGTGGTAVTGGAVGTAVTTGSAVTGDTGGTGFTGGTGGTVTRIHQEDGAAALGVDPTGRLKYQSQDPSSPSLRKIATLLRRHGLRWINDSAALAQDIILRVAVGDSDGHARNYSFLHTGDAIEMAPIYDVAPTHLHVASKRLGLYVHDQPYLAHVTAAHLAEEVHAWGVPKDAATRLVVANLERLAAAIPDAARRIPHAPDRTITSVATRIEKLLRST